MENSSEAEGYGGNAGNAENVKNAEKNLRPIRKKEQAFLTRELEHWKWLNLLDDEQASAIFSLYEPAKERFLQIFMGLGAMLVGLGLLSYIAANWMVFGRALKVAIIVGAYVLSVLAAWRFEPEYPYTSRAFLLLGGFAYGGGIFLIAQIFNEGGAVSDALFWWMAGLVPACLLFRDRMQLLLVQAVSLAYFHSYYANWWWPLLGSRHGWDLPFGFMGFIKYFIAGYPGLVFAGLWLLWFLCRDEEGGLRDFGLHMNIFVTLNVFTILAARYYMDMCATLLLLFAAGVFICFFCVFCDFASFAVFTRRFRRAGDVLEGWGVSLTGVFGIALSFSAVWEWSESMRSLEFFGAADFCLRVFNVPPEVVFSGAAAILTCFVLLLRVHRGSLLAAVFFCFTILRYYFDIFYDFMDKALYFTTGGVLLMAMGFYLQRARKKRKPAVAAPAVADMADADTADAERTALS